MFSLRRSNPTLTYISICRLFDARSACYRKHWTIMSHRKWNENTCYNNFHFPSWVKIVHRKKIFRDDPLVDTFDKVVANAQRIENNLEKLCKPEAGSWKSPIRKTGVAARQSDDSHRNRYVSFFCIIIIDFRHGYGWQSPVHTSQGEPAGGWNWGEPDMCIFSIKSTNLTF